jgi:hypothetical protein
MKLLGFGFLINPGGEKAMVGAAANEVQTMRGPVFRLKEN